MNEHSKNFNKLVDQTAVKFAPTYFSSCLVCWDFFCIVGLLGLFSPLVLQERCVSYCPFRCSNSESNFFPVEFVRCSRAQVMLLLYSLHGDMLKLLNSIAQQYSLGFL